MSKKCNHNWSFDGESSDHKMGFFTCNLCGAKYTSEGVPDSFYQPDSIIDQLKIEIHRHGQTTTSLVCYEAMKNINSNDKRIADLLAVIERKDAALKFYAECNHYMISDGGDTMIQDWGNVAQDALAITPESVELVELPILFMGEPAYSIKNKS